jgi:hypothetical protein
MGLDVGNDFGQFHLNWAGTRWFRQWCQDEGMPDPFIGWVSGDNSGDQCVLGKARALSDKEWERRALAAWYAILKHGVEHGDTLTYC